MIEGLKPYPAYQPSGVQSVGDVPEHWTVRRAKVFFEEVDERSTDGDEEMLSVSHKTGVTPRREKNVTMFLAESNVGHKVVRRGDIAVNTMWAWMAALGVSRHDGIVSPSYGVYRPQKPGLFLFRYLDELLRIPQYRDEYLIRSTGITTSRLRLYPDAFLRIPVPCPDVEEQAAIVRFLDHADRRIRRYIAAKQKLIKLLEEQKQAIIHRAVTRGLDPDVILKPSEVDWLGEVPAHWIELPLKRISSSDNSGCYGLEPERGEFVYPVATTAQIDRNGSFATERMPRRGFSEREVKRYLCRDGQILVVKSSGSITNVISGKAGLVRVDTPPFVFSNFLMRVTPRRDLVSSEYLFLLLSNHLTKERVKRMVAGSTYPNLRVGEYLSSLLPVPPIQEQYAIVAEVASATSAVERAIKAALQEVDLLREYRTRLIADVVTGKLDVRAAAAALPKEVDDAPPIDEVEPSEDDADAPEDDAP